MGSSYDVMREAALEATGRKHRRLIVGWEVTRFLAPFVAGVVALGGLGLAAFMVWSVWIVPAFTFTPEPAVADDGGTPVATATVATVSAVPGWSWLALIGVGGALFWVFRPGRIVLHAGGRVVEVFVLAIVSAALAGFTIFTMTH